jgi:hypothetical protein
MSHTPPGTRHASRGHSFGKDPLPIGTIVVRGRTGNDRHQRALQKRYIKVCDDGPMQLRWVIYAKWWWEQNRGPVPAGMMVLHADMDTMNDEPENLVLGDASTKMKLCQSLDPETARENRRARKEATSDWNRLSGKLQRLREVLKDHWYPVLDSAGVILNTPFQKRPDLLRWFGADTTFMPKNWRGAKVPASVESIKVRPVQGCDLGAGGMASYPRVDLEWEIGAGSGGMSPFAVVEKIKLLKREFRPLWDRALEASKKDHTDRSLS